ncbi:MAG: hypothetical protein KAH32_05920 [Chlamydiia bacterium]|nr:hypothetical protein [Chlamydiia bacterium]
MDNIFKAGKTLLKATFSSTSPVDVVLASSYAVAVVATYYIIVALRRAVSAFVKHMNKRGTLKTVGDLEINMSDSIRLLQEKILIKKTIAFTNEQIKENIVNDKETEQKEVVLREKLRALQARLDSTNAKLASPEMLDVVQKAKSIADRKSSNNVQDNKEILGIVDNFDKRARSRDIKDNLLSVIKSALDASIAKSIHTFSDQKAEELGFIKEEKEEISKLFGRYVYRFYMKSEGYTSLQSTFQEESYNDNKEEYVTFFLEDKFTSKNRDDLKEDIKNRLEKSKEFMEYLNESVEESVISIGSEAIANKYGDILSELTKYNSQKLVRLLKDAENTS